MTRIDAHGNHHAGPGTGGGQFQPTPVTGPDVGDLLGSPACHDQEWRFTMDGWDVSDIRLTASPGGGTLVRATVDHPSSFTSQVARWVGRDGDGDRLRAALHAAPAPDRAWMDALGVFLASRAARRYGCHVWFDTDTITLRVGLSATTPAPVDDLTGAHVEHLLRGTRSWEAMSFDVRTSGWFSWSAWIDEYARRSPMP